MRVTGYRDVAQPMKADKDPDKYEYLKIPDYLMPKPRV